MIYFNSFTPHNICSFPVIGVNCYSLVPVVCQIFVVAIAKAFKTTVAVIVLKYTYNPSPAHINMLLNVEYFGKEGVTLKQIV
jgi:hypothetical protein